ncbi:hypothetical protein V6Z12_D08G095300 [Gossypium hirsutum]
MAYNDGRRWFSGYPMTSTMAVVEVCDEDRSSTTDPFSVFSRKVLTITEGNFAVTDINGNIMFKIKGKFFSIHDRRLLTDAAGNPVCTLRPKIMTVHDRWQVFRGESTEEKDLIFTVKRSSMIQLKTKLHVFLATNPKEDVCDFRVEGSWLERSCIIYSGESNTILAQAGTY